jgi:outer membrane protein assembly factor BamA
VPVRKRRFFVLLMTFSSAFCLNAQGSDKPHGTGVAVRSLVFTKPTPLSSQEQKELRRQIQAPLAEFSTDRWREDLADLAGEYVRAAYQNKGYFLAKVSPEVIQVAGSSFAPEVDLFFRVNEGPQCWLREIHWKNMTAFSEEQLSSLMSIHPGEIFNRAKIAEGLEAVQKLYGSQGYLNFVSIPETKIDEVDHGIVLDIDVDEGGMFRWGELHIEGMSQRDEEELLRAWDLRGQPYTQQSIQACQQLFEKYFRPVRRGIKPSDYTRNNLNEANRTVDVYLSLSPDASLVKNITKPK